MRFLILKFIRRDERAWLLAYDVLSAVGNQSINEAFFDFGIYLIFQCFPFGFSALDLSKDSCVLALHALALYMAES